MRKKLEKFRCFVCNQWATKEAYIAINDKGENAPIASICLPCSKSCKKLEVNNLVDLYRAMYDHLISQAQECRFIIKTYGGKVGGLKAWLPEKKKVKK